MKEKYADFLIKNEKMKKTSKEPELCEMRLKNIIELSRANKLKTISSKEFDKEIDSFLKSL